MLLERAKAQWQADHPNGTDWPTEGDLLPYLTHGIGIRSIQQFLEPHHGEVYLVNKIGAPVIAYHPEKGERVYAGELIYLRSNELRQVVP